jgi:hypothetical protein
VKNVSKCNAAFIDAEFLLLLPQISSRKTLYEVVVYIEKRLKVYVTRLRAVKYKLISIKQRMTVVYFELISHIWLLLVFNNL